MVRFACPSAAAAALVCSLAVATPSAAQESSAPSLREAAEAAAHTLVPDTAPRSGGGAELRDRRPSALVPLYVSFSTLQVLDTHSTSRALSRGAAEANPLMKGIARSEIGMAAVKAAGTAGVIYASEKMWKKNKKAAVIFMVATNAAMAWVVQHNYRAGR
jgi:hypothetical protein